MRRAALDRSQPDVTPGNARTQINLCVLCVSVATFLWALGGSVAPTAYQVKLPDGGGHIRNNWRVVMICPK